MDWSKLLCEKRLRPSTREQDVKGDNRNEFESDYGRIAFSPAIRRMHDKTQVFPLTTDDNIHTRLTHSIEVQSVAYSIGIDICDNQDFIDHIGDDLEDRLDSGQSVKEFILRRIPMILSSTAFCHDIGNPPFGHYGEAIIQNYFKELFSKDEYEDILKPDRKEEFTNFDGNAQGFRVLTKLQILGDRYGLNLTLGTLASYLKYPCLATEYDSDVKGDYKNKIGVFESEKEHLQEIRNQTGLKGIRHPLAFLMEAADSICYVTMDIEDGFNKGYYDYEDIRSYVGKHANDKYKAALEEFDEKLEKVYITPGFNEDVTKIVRFRTFLIQQLVNEACDEFIKKLPEIEKGTFRGELILEKGSDKLGSVLQRFCYENIFNHRDIRSLELTGESVMSGLLDHFIPALLKSSNESKGRSKKLVTLISESLRYVGRIDDGRKFIKNNKLEDNLDKLSDYNKLRIVTDYITGMTDSFALRTYQKLSGHKIA